MLAVGALVPTQGRLGKSWRHADGLKNLAEYARPLSGEVQNVLMARIDSLQRTRPIPSLWLNSGKHIRSTNAKIMLKLP